MQISHNFEQLCLPKEIYDAESISKQEHEGDVTYDSYATQGVGNNRFCGGFRGARVFGARARAAQLYNN